MPGFNTFTSIATEVKVNAFNRKHFVRRICGKCGEPWLKNGHPCKVPVSSEHGFTYDMTTYHTEAPTASGMDKIQVERQVRAEAVRIWKESRAL